MYTAAACKQRWQGLRDAYRRALNKKKAKSGQAAKKMKKWKYEDEMSFVIPFFIEKRTSESVDLTAEYEEFQKEDEVTEVQNPTDNEINSADAVNVDAAHDTEIWDEDVPVVLNKSSQPQHCQVKKIKAKKRAKVVPVQSASAVLMSRLLDEQSLIPLQNQHDELDRFFLNISETVRKFSPYLQAMAKNKIFTLVSEMELQQLVPPSFITTTPLTYTSSPASTSSYIKRSDTPTPTPPETWDTSTNVWNNTL